MTRSLPPCRSLFRLSRRDRPDEGALPACGARMHDVPRGPAGAQAAPREMPATIPTDRAFCGKCHATRLREPGDGQGRHGDARRKVPVLAVPLSAYAGGEIDMERRSFVRQVLAIVAQGTMLGWRCTPVRTRTGMTIPPDTTTAWASRSRSVSVAAAAWRRARTRTTSRKPFFYRTWVERYVIRKDGEVIRASINGGETAAAGADDGICAASSCRSSATIARIRPASRCAPWVRRSRPKTA